MSYAKLSNDHYKQLNQLLAREIYDNNSVADFIGPINLFNLFNLFNQEKLRIPFQIIILTNLTLTASK